MTTIWLNKHELREGMGKRPEKKDAGTGYSVVTLQMALAKYYYVVSCLDRFPVVVDYCTLYTTLFVYS